MRKLLRENGLSIVLFVIFFGIQIGLSLVGHRVYNEDQKEHGRPIIGYGPYLLSDHFLEATMENWESEFLQMAAFAIFTAFLFQKGSAESKKLDEEEPVDRDPRGSSGNPDAPWPVRRGGAALVVYEYSLSLALLLLFVLSFGLHAMSGARLYNSEQLAHGGATVGTIGYLGTAQFWFESLQNWQSEFLSIGVMVVLTIFLRQRGSSQSKPVDSPHAETGHK